MSFTDIFQTVLIISVVGVLAIWWWVFYLLFARKKDNVGRAAFMMLTFLCLTCEMARIIDPFTRWGIWSNETLRTYLTLELLLMLTLLLVASDAASWLNYFSAESLLLKPQRRYRHSIYVGIVLLIVESIISVSINTFKSQYTRGMTIGWLLSALLMVLIGLFTMLQSLREVEIAVKLEQDTILEDVHNVFFFATEYKEEDDEKRSKSRKKSFRLAKYLSCLACLFLFDLCFGEKPSKGDMDLLHLMYDSALKILLAVMLFQRRPIKVARTYEVDIHQRYKPFDQTIFSGCDATRTVYKLREMLRKKESEIALEKSFLIASKNHECDKASEPMSLPEDHQRTPSNTIPLQAVEMTEKLQHTDLGSETDMRVRPPIEILHSKDSTSNNRKNVTRPIGSESESLNRNDKQGTDAKFEVLSDELKRKGPPIIERIGKSQVCKL